MVRKLVALLLLVVLGFVALVLMQPSSFRVVRSTTIAAPAAAVFEQVNRLQNWEAWSPWAKRDPAMKKSYDGPPSGVGASHAWAGHRDVGEGRMTITESRPPELIRIRLEFIKPFPGVNDVEFTFAPEGQQTVVTWSFAGTCNFMSKICGLFVSMDKMIGGDFEAGLAALKAVAEAAPRS